MMEIYAQIPATYTEDDPLDGKAMHGLLDSLHTAWWMETPDKQRQAIANALRGALTSPQQVLKWNSIVYQDLLHFPADANDPAAFEQHIRDRREKWNQMGQTTLDMAMGRTDLPEIAHYAPHMVEKYNPGIWNNIRNAGGVGAYIEPLRQIALEDIAQGGDGRIWRQKVMALNVPGVGPKIAAFAWLLLNPKGSRLATIDVHMMRSLGEDSEVPRNLGHYHELEDKLDKNRIAHGYSDLPLGAYQWAVWDNQRTPGWHQDHSPLRPLDPTPWDSVDWAPSVIPRPSKAPEVHQDQMSLAKWQDAPVAWREAPTLWR